MILKDMDFTEFYKHIESIFNMHFSYEETKQIMEYVEILSEANFKCYCANMVVIQTRKARDDDYTLISDLEWVARSVGEYRVSSKAMINLYISRVKTEKVPTEAVSWISDDIVYSIGEMMDRLSIEVIKREDFSKNNRPDYMRKSSQELSDRVEKYLIAKLREVDKKGFYECVQEQRTYDLEGIVKDLAI